MVHTNMIDPLWQSVHPRGGAGGIRAFDLSIRHTLYHSTSTVLL